MITNFYMQEDNQLIFYDLRKILIEFYDLDKFKAIGLSVAHSKGLGVFIIEDEDGRYLDFKLFGEIAEEEGQALSGTEQEWDEFKALNFDVEKFVK